jgi:hypothetical protein
MAVPHAEAVTENFIELRITTLADGQNHYAPNKTLSSPCGDPLVI